MANCLLLSVNRLSLTLKGLEQPKYIWHGYYRTRFDQNNFQIREKDKVSQALSNRIREILLIMGNYTNGCGESPIDASATNVKLNSPSCSSTQIARSLSIESGHYEQAVDSILLSGSSI